VEYGGLSKRTDELFSVSAPKAMKKFFQGLKVSYKGFFVMASRMR